jgi:hypothetical protein
MNREARDQAFATHRREQMLRMAQMPFSQKLEWLEEAHEMVLSMQRAQNQSRREVEPNGENREEA